MPLLRTLQHEPWPLSTAIPPRLNASRPIEEERTPYYDPSSFYPVQLGEVLNGRYQIATKLGYGSGSSVWLARDLYQFVCLLSTSYHLLTLSRWRWLEERYLAVKIKANRPNSPLKASEGELGMLRHISKANPRHKGWHFVRKPLSSFTLDGVSGKHQCLVFEPLREPLWLYRERFIGNVIPPEAVLPTSKPFGPVLVKPGTRPGVPSGLVGLVGRALCPEQCRSYRNGYRSYP
jgi:serine/threonine-protein kinase SRPK3